MKAMSAREEIKLPLKKGSGALHATMLCVNLNGAFRELIDVLLNVCSCHRRSLHIFF
jgi:hypothetical protein